MNHNNSAYQKKSTDLSPYILGYNYQHGIEVEKDAYKAFIYYQKSIEMGNASGAYHVGCFYRDGNGVEKDEKKAFVYFKKSAEMGHVNGTYNVGLRYQNGNGIEKDEKKAFEYFKKSAEMGHAGGVYNVGIRYQNGNGVEKDEKKAFEYFKKSAEMVYNRKSAKMGHVDGTYMVGSCYLNGKGVEKDEKKAFEYFKKAADLGEVNAILQVGDCYRNGIGVPQDIQRANHWYRIERDRNKINNPSYENFNDNLKKILDDDKYQLLWIPYNEFQNIKEIGKGGFATVYSASWHDKRRNFNTHIALKLIHGSNECNQEFVDELKTYCDIGYENPSFLKCYGISSDNKSKDYIIVLKYAKKGSLRQNLGSIVQMKWEDKLNVLYNIASDLESIHSQELIHRDLHSGNILQNYLHSAYITDLGLSTSSNMNMNQKKGEINGIMPYVAPEVLMGQPLTQAADIYGFGIIMYEISTGKKAFDGEPFDTKLAVKICQGKRPEFDMEIPNCYIKFAKKCMDRDQNKRPAATVLCNIIGYWHYEMKEDDDSEIKKQFLEADKIELNLESSKHPNDMYVSNSINTQEITTRLSKLPDNL